jgi:TolB-like protein/Tfp pilus assembly protein PilF/predicted Ser/Thr protein kinase
MIGKTISHYRILEKLGEGGMGVVYKAEDTKLKRTVALKFLPPELVLREAQAAAALDHPNICTVHEIDDAEGHSFITMAFIDGQSLATRIESGPLEVDEAVNIAVRVAEGLKHAHKRGIVHRDIKPANIMITEDGQAKIMDFGLAKLTGKTRLTRTATVMGTVAYMSPEQARGDSAVDDRTDVWSLGVLLYEMLTGALPFDAETDAGLIYKIIHEDPIPVINHRSDIPASLASIVERAMQKNPQDRYEDAGEVIAELEPVKSGVMSMQKQSPSIAVLPFVNMSADPDQEYFCDGLAEELINALTQIKDLKVIARTSAFSFRGKEVDVRDIGRKLDVGTVLEGSVRKAGKRLRITAQLVDTAHGHHLWSERYDRDMEDIFAIQDEISGAIVERLKPALLGEEEEKRARRQPVDIEAYNLYLRGNWHFSTFNEEGFRKAFQYFNQALEKDPDCALAYAGLAGVYAALSSVTNSPTTETMPKAREAALKALQIDDTLAEAHSALAVVKTRYDWDWSGAEQEYKRAIELNPGDVGSLNVYALHLMFMGRINEAIEKITRALELDPLAPLINFTAGVVFFYAKQYDQVIDKFRDTIEIVPDLTHAHVWLGRAYSAKSMYDEALKEFAREKEITKGANVGVALYSAEVYMKMGKREKVRELLDDVLKRASEQSLTPVAPAFLHFLLGENDQAFDWMDRAYEARDRWLCYIKIEPLFQSLQYDPRYIALLKKIGLDT